MKLDDPGAGRQAIVTRPQPQADQWVSKLRAHGLPATALPLLQITPAPDPAAVRAAIARLRAGDVAMFVSPNAASACFACLDASAWPAGVLAAATGPGTVAVLSQQGVPPTDIVAPPSTAAQFDSESLWAQLRGQDWSARQVCIVRGDGGRDWLADTWREAGAQVSFVQAYGRGLPSWTPAQQAVLAQALAAPDSACWLLSSSEALDHLATLAPAADWGASTALASHPRIAARARSLGFGRVIELRPTLDAVVEAWRSLPAA